MRSEYLVTFLEVLLTEDQFYKHYIDSEAKTFMSPYYSETVRNKPLRCIIEHMQMLNLVMHIPLQRPDLRGKEPKLILWQHPGNDVTGLVARSEKVATTCEKVIQ